jgi:hypothetical protein
MRKVDMAICPTNLESYQIKPLVITKTKIRSLKLCCLKLKVFESPSIYHENGGIDGGDRIAPKAFPLIYLP